MYRILEAGGCRSVALRRIRLQGASVSAYMVRSATLCFLLGSGHLSLISPFSPFIVAAMSRDVVKDEASQEYGCQSSMRVKLLADIRWILGNRLKFTKSLAS